MRTGTCAVAAMLLLSVAGLFGCGVDSGSTASTGMRTVSVPHYADPWVVIEGDSIEMALPQEWNGGDPSDPAVAAAAKRAWGEDIVASVSEHAGEGEELVLIAWLGSEGGLIGHVLVVRGPWPEPASMEEIVTDLTGGTSTSTAEVAVESVTAERAYIVLSLVSSGSEEPGSESELQHVVLLKSGSYMYAVGYGCNKSWEDKGDPTFRTSAETIALD